MSRAQSIVHRTDRILMVKHSLGSVEWWCLPGGAIEEGETPAEAALRELEEECGVDGTIIRQTSVTGYLPGDTHFTFLVDIGDQQPRLGYDPELGEGEQILMDLQWLSLRQIPERDRAFLWAGGLIGVEPFTSLLEDWGDALSYPVEGDGEPGSEGRS